MGPGWCSPEPLFYRAGQMCTPQCFYDPLYSFLRPLPALRWVRALPAPAVQAACGACGWLVQRELHACLWFLGPSPRAGSAASHSLSQPVPSPSPTWVPSATCCVISLLQVCALASNTLLSILSFEKSAKVSVTGVSTNLNKWRDIPCS